MPEYELLTLVRKSGAFESDEEADETIEATLEALGRCLSAGERRAIADPLPEHYASDIREAEGADASPLEFESFIEYVRTEAAIDHPREKIRAVLSGLTQIVGEDEIENARDQLPPEYGKLFEPATLEPDETFVDLVAAEGGFEHDTAQTAARETLAVLGHRLSEGEAEDIAPYLRGDASEWLSRKATHDAEDFSAEEFVRRVSNRAEVPEGQARKFTGVVGDALTATVPENERERAQAQLPEQYASVLNLD